MLYEIICICGLNLYVPLCRYFKGKCFDRAVLDTNTAGITQVVVYHNPAFIYGNCSGLMGTASLTGATPGASFLIQYQSIVLVCHLDILTNVLIALC